MAGRSIEVLAPIEQLLERLSVNAVFGPPVREGDTTVIPVADVALGFGYGYGEGPARAEGEEEGGPGDAAAAEGTSGGGGGGGGGRASPRGFLRLSPEGVSYEPIMDQGRIALAGIAMVAWVVFWVARTVRAFAPVCECCRNGECECGAGHEPADEGDAE